MLAFKNKEMKRFMDEARLKSDNSKRNKMFGFGFNGKKKSDTRFDKIMLKDIKDKINLCYNKCASS